MDMMNSPFLLVFMLFGVFVLFSFGLHFFQLFNTDSTSNCFGSCFIDTIQMSMRLLAVTLSRSSFVYFPLPLSGRSSRFISCSLRLFGIPYTFRTVHTSSTYIFTAVYLFFFHWLSEDVMMASICHGTIIMKIIQNRFVYCI